MASDETLIQTRTKWISIYQQLGNITVAARRCGIARSTLQRWRSAARLKRQSVEGLADKSRRPRRLARKKFDDNVENLVLDIRDKFNFGKIRICSHLFQHYQIKTSPATVARILKQNQCAPIKRYRKQQTFIRYSPVPGDRVQPGGWCHWCLQDKKRTLSIYGHWRL